MAIHVLQGERELVADCRSLARFELRGFPPMVAGAARIRVTFQVDADGLLGVTAREEASGAEAQVVVKPSYGLTDTEIEQMLRDSISHATEDNAARHLREQQVEADQVVEAIQSALASDGERFLTAAERVRIDSALAGIRAARTGSDPQAIKQAVVEADRATREFAMRRMNAGVREALAGHRVDEF